METVPASRRYWFILCILFKTILVTAFLDSYILDRRIVRWRWVMKLKQKEIYHFVYGSFTLLYGTYFLSVVVPLQYFFGTEIYRFYLFHFKFNLPWTLKWWDTFHLSPMGCIKIVFFIIWMRYLLHHAHILQVSQFGF